MREAHAALFAEAAISQAIAVNFDELGLSGGKCRCTFASWRSCCGGSRQGSKRTGERGNEQGVTEH